MANTPDAIIIGAGHNGLITAFYLARAGLRPLVLERSQQVGGAAITQEFYPGFRGSLLAHSAGPLRPEIMRDLQLERWGLKWIVPAVTVAALSPDGNHLVLYRDLERAAAEIGKRSAGDQANYRNFATALERVSRVVRQALVLTPPEVEHPTFADLLGLMGLGRSLRSIGRSSTYQLLRWAPMAIADLVSEFFQDELVRATIAARGIFGAFLGPWSAGTGLLLLLRAAGDTSPSGENFFALGGMGALTEAMAKSAKRAGAEIRTGAEVKEIRVQKGAAEGVVLRSGEEIRARAVISSADPRRTFFEMIDPGLLNPSFARRVENYRMHGVVAKVNLALSGLPTFTGLERQKEALAGRIHVGPHLDYLERAFDDAKYGEFSREPYLEVTFPSLSDPSLVPSGQEVMSVYMQYAPYQLKQGTWESQRAALGDTVVNTLATYAPDLPSKILERQVITPLDLEASYGLTGGHIFHGELALDQVFTMRPIMDWARYRTPIENLYLCGSGTHPGIGLTGGSGANAAREILKQLKN
jgi:phytoene dehydrogenase-like protein